MKKNLAVLLGLLAAGCVGRFDPEDVSKRDSGTAANPIVEEASRQFGVPKDWIRAVIQRESGGRTVTRKLVSAARCCRRVVRR